MTFIDAHKIKDIVETRTIKHLIHFTRIDNLQSIFTNGLHPRASDKNNAEINSKNDGNDNGVCLSISHSSSMFYRVRDGASTDWCVIILAPDILWECECRFYPINAVSNILKSVSDKKFIGARALETMFKNSITNSEGQQERRNSHLLSYMPTNPQAEIRVLEPIKPSYFKGIHVENIDDGDKIRDMDNLPNHISIDKQKYFFGSRNYYMTQARNREEYIKWLKDLSF